MLHGINNTFLYAAKKIITKCTNGTETEYFRGTGFFIQKDSIFFFVTNRHVIEPGYSDAKYVGYNLVELSIESYETFDADKLPRTLSTSTLVNIEDFTFSQNDHNDIACIKNPKFPNKIIINAPIPYEMIASNEWINGKLSVCDTIAYPGFPEWYDRQNKTPIFRMGTIASDPRLNYSYVPGAPNAARIAYEGFSTGGASGSPVFAIQRGFPIGVGLSAPDGFYREVKLIGINAGHFKDQAVHSGISYLYKSSAILEIIDSI